MTVSKHIDPICSVELLLSELFQKVFQNDGARRQFGFSSISQHITPEGLPSWYVWFSEKKGAYSLTLTDGHVSPRAAGMSGHAINEDYVMGARLLIRYFPSLDEDTFDSLSCLEQIFRMGPHFDSTGTPSFEGGRIMDNRFFTAGYIDVLIYSAFSYLDFFCSAPNRWLEYRPDGLTFTDNTDRSYQLVVPGKADRTFPGWEFTFFLFDKIVSSYCFMTGHAPLRTGASSRPSFHYEIDREGRVESVRDYDIIESILGVSFLDETFEELENEKSSHFAVTLLSEDYTPVGMWKHPENIPSVWRNPEWWTIKDHHFHADQDHSCSCYEDH